MCFLGCRCDDVFVCSCHLCCLNVSVCLSVCLFAGNGLQVDSVLSSREKYDDTTHGTLTSVNTTLMQVRLEITIATTFACVYTRRLLRFPLYMYNLLYTCHDADHTLEEMAKFAEGEEGNRGSSCCEATSAS